MTAQSTQQGATMTSILPPDTGAAMSIMNALTRQLLEFMMDEGHALRQGQEDLFTRAQQGKEKLIFGYQKASKEFQERAEEFRGLNGLDQLQALTQELGRVTRENQPLINALQPAEKATEKRRDTSLLFLQEDTDSSAATSAASAT